VLNLDTPIEKLVGVGTKNLPRLKRLGLETVKDLLWHFPHRYEDYRRQVPAEEIREPGEIVSLRGEVVKIKTTSLWRRRSVTEAFIQDHSGVVRAVWFNQPYLENSLPLQTVVSLSGKTALDKHGLYLSNPHHEKLQADFVHTSRLVPIYPETEGLTSKYLRFLIKPLLHSFGTPSFASPSPKALEGHSKASEGKSEGQALFDSLPQYILEKYNFPPLAAAIKKIHFPDSPEEAEQARERMAFEELFLFQLRSIANRRQALQLKAPVIKFEPETVKQLVNSLPFELTDDQKVAAFEILKDLEKKYPMNRLLNGDVGSGKTIVALMAAYQTVRQQKQVAFMAPTEILAQQHFDSVKMLLSRIGNYELGIRVGLLTGSEAQCSELHDGHVIRKKLSKKTMQEKIAKGEVDLLIGTHAVIQKDVKFKNLALVVIDEQHRFGVEQRMKLLRNYESGIMNQESEKSIIHNSKFLIPHLLSMTATPIPRTLALTIYGDLDISLIKEKPKNRKKIVTKVVSKKDEIQAYRFLKQEIKAGRQVFVICPRIETQTIDNRLETMAKRKKEGELAIVYKQSTMSSLWAEVKAVTTEYEKLSQKVFPHLKIAMLHGKMKPKEKEKIMSAFKNGFYDILVSTSVVEVGVDIPNASVMLIENAERFGLAQLHQFRGRVGRAEHQSYCLLVNGGNSRSENTRLKALEKCDDGFQLAEEDLKLRGPGEFTGHKQSGLPDLAMASLTNLELIKKARLEAKLLLKEDPGLSNYPPLKKQLDQFQKIRHFE